ncbi:UNVERIFIED_ORG: transposase-like protein [Arthrobacter sp. UYCu721]
MTITARRRDRRHLRESVPAQPPLPKCHQCGTDAYLEFTGYVPASYDPDPVPDSLRPPVVSYNCKHCGKHYSHQAPEDWAPPGWQWYA